MARAARKELDSMPLFPELARFRSAEERFSQIDLANRAYWQRQRDLAARMWWKFRRRLLSLPAPDRGRFLSYWNGHTCLPGTAEYACDTLTTFFDRADWRAADVAEIQGGAP